MQQGLYTPFRNLSFPVSHSLISPLAACGVVSSRLGSSRLVSSRPPFFFHVFCLIFDYFICGILYLLLC